MIHFKYQFAIDIKIDRSWIIIKSNFCVKTVRKRWRDRMKHIADQFMMGETEIIICDDQCVCKEEAEEILKDLAQKIKFGATKERHQSK